MRRCRTCKINKKNAEFDNHKVNKGIACLKCKDERITNKCSGMPRDVYIQRLNRNNTLRERYGFNSNSVTKDYDDFKLSYEEFENIKGLE